VSASIVGFACSKNTLLYGSSPLRDVASASAGRIRIARVSTADSSPRAYPDPPHIGASPPHKKPLPLGRGLHFFKSTFYPHSPASGQSPLSSAVDNPDSGYRWSHPIIPG